MPGLAGGHIKHISPQGWSLRVKLLTIPGHYPMDAVVSIESIIVRNYLAWQLLFLRTEYKLTRKQQFNEKPETGDE